MKLIKGDKMNFDINRDYRIFYPILAIFIMTLGITLPNMDSYLTIIFAFASLLVGSSYVKTIAISPNEVYLATGSKDEGIHIWYISNPFYDIKFN